MEFRPMPTRNSTYKSTVSKIPMKNSSFIMFYIHSPSLDQSTPRGGGWIQWFICHLGSKIHIVFQSVHTCSIIVSSKCMVEAFPVAVNWWERHDGRQIQQRYGKYRRTSDDSDGYKTNEKLNISLSDPRDFGTYYCISKNEKGLTKAAIELFERDPNSSLPPPVVGGFRPTVFGEEPPDFQGMYELCPQRNCPDCEKLHAQRCEGSARMYGLNILPYDEAYGNVLPHLPNRTEG